MGEAFFYHMTRTPLEETLPVLLSKALDAGWRVSVTGREAERLDWLDERLWIGPEPWFLPHGRAGGPQDADQPVLLVAEGEMAGEAGNRAQCLVSVDGAGLDPGAVRDSDRAMVLFDGNDPDAVERARAQWRDFTGAGIAVKYWSQESGRWALKAEA